jgi:hypothetical protein
VADLNYGAMTWQHLCKLADGAAQGKAPEPKADDVKIVCVPETKAYVRWPSNAFPESLHAQIGHVQGLTCRPVHAAGSLAALRRRPRPWRRPCASRLPC